jgi:hypothetical protein
MRKLSADANRQTVPISPVRKASESDARHSSSRRLMLESAAFNLAMSARANLDWSRPHFPLGEPGPFAFWRKDWGHEFVAQDFTCGTQVNPFLFFLRL